MRLTVTIEQRFDSLPDGSIWTESAYDYEFLTRYLDVFDEVRVLARTRRISSVPRDYRRVDGNGVSMLPLPHYLGPQEYLLKLRAIQRTIRKGIASQDACILRVPSQIATVALAWIDRPYGLEVVGDPYDVFAPGAVRHPLRPFFRWWFSRQLRRQCARASGIAYVTESALQCRYPPSTNAFTTSYSSVELPGDAFAAKPRPMGPLKPTFRMILVGSLWQLYKAPDVLLKAIALNIRDGLDLHLTIVGDGKHRIELETQAAALGLGNQVRFLGQVSAGEAVREQLDQADLFVLASRTEGLPRAMIEAMARGLPCIGSTVGGIPELLPSEDMVPPGDARLLAEKIKEIVTDPNRMTLMSARNWQKAHQYSTQVLRERRMAFYQAVRNQTQDWLDRQGHQII